MLRSPAARVRQLISVYKIGLGVAAMSGTKLTQLFLFNPSWGPREGQEEEKVVFHWPAHLDANTRVRSVGLIEAVVRWASLSFTFNWMPFKVWGNLQQGAC